MFFSCFSAFFLSSHDLGNNMKKCRARFGLDQQNQWCKPCRWATISRIIFTKALEKYKSFQKLSKIVKTPNISMAQWKLSLIKNFSKQTKRNNKINFIYLRFFSVSHIFLFANEIVPWIYTNLAQCHIFSSYRLIIKP